jgi:hypothetical protein
VRIGLNLPVTDIYSLPPTNESRLYYKGFGCAYAAVSATDVRTFYVPYNNCSSAPNVLPGGEVNFNRFVCPCGNRTNNIPTFKPAAPPTISVPPLECSAALSLSTLVTTTYNTISNTPGPSCDLICASKGKQCNEDTFAVMNTASCCPWAARSASGLISDDGESLNLDAAYYGYFSGVGCLYQYFSEIKRIQSSYIPGSTCSSGFVIRGQTIQSDYKFICPCSEYVAGTPTVMPLAIPPTLAPVIALPTECTSLSTAYLIAGASNQLGKSCNSLCADLGKTCLSSVFSVMNTAQCCPWAVTIATIATPGVVVSSDQATDLTTGIFQGAIGGNGCGFIDITYYLFTGYIPKMSCSDTPVLYAQLPYPFGFVCPCSK